MRLAPQVVAVQLDQIEGVQEGAAVMATKADAVERCDSVIWRELVQSSGSHRRDGPSTCQQNCWEPNGPNRSLGCRLPPDEQSSCPRESPRPLLSVSPLDESKVGSLFNDHLLG
jgi:hypothetical protein